MKKKKQETYAFLSYATYSHIPVFSEIRKKETRRKKPRDFMKKSITTYRGIKKENRHKFSCKENMHLV